MLDMVEETVEKIQKNQEQHEGDYLDEEGLHDVESAEKGKRTDIFLWEENDFFPVSADATGTDWRSRKKKIEKGNLLSG